MGRCPFHGDGGRPNLYVYTSTQSWFCYRCNIGGDVISFVEHIERLGFRDAVALLTGERSVSRKARQPTRRVKPCASRRAITGQDERSCLTAAVELYHNRLLTDSAALAYVHSRGLGDDVIERCRLGYAAGDELISNLRCRRLPVQAALRVGLLRRSGCEFIAGRVVVPVIREGQPIWLVGRTLDSQPAVPKYLGLPGRKPLLGWEAAKDSREVFVVEGVFDWLTLLHWGYPSVALIGTHARPEVVEMLTAFERVYITLDSDEAGQAAAETLAQVMGRRVVIVSLPRVKDVAELATVPDGLRIFARSVMRHRDQARVA